MSFLDEMKEQKKNNIRENPLANIAIKKNNLHDSTIRVDGDTHSKILALRNVYVDMNNKEVFQLAVDRLIKSLSLEDRTVFEKYYEIEIEQKINKLKKKGLY